MFHTTALRRTSATIGARSFSNNARNTIVQRAKTMWEYWTRERAPLNRWSGAWWREQLIVCSVFAVTGSSAMFLVRPALKNIGIDGSWRDGPWSYRIGSVFVMTPCYSFLLLVFGTVAGRHAYFRRVALRMWGRVLPARVISRFQQKPPIKQ